MAKKGNKGKKGGKKDDGLYYLAEGSKKKKYYGKKKKSDKNKKQIELDFPNKKKSCKKHFGSSKDRFYGDDGDDKGFGCY